ncbi:NB-ARC domain-containing disease resistance protein [Melia azedarach]|uniref:NB-ARC domain-containing disease resistance protein n=1 Tax=Melia azedarach TaxID=155640 RepID=A0ACC1XE50_MELAZ|nr:NB-ARC domain-containing disease resistance protein [Melia azedarach]
MEDNTSLETITITDCKNLKFLPDGLCNLRHLQEIYICDCPNLVSFCKGGLLSTKLTKLWINGCNKLEALPNCMHRLTSLQNLAIGICPSTVSFPENGFPTNLTSLAIYDKICKPLFEWGLSRFTSLKHLSIGRCPDVVSFPQEEMGMTIPASLTHLDIVNFPSLERLSSIGENLTALKFLRLSDCPKLKFFPKNGLPSSLSQLHIESCPLIEEKCRKDKGKYWHLITHIPYVSINHSWVFDCSAEDD